MFAGLVLSWIAPLGGQLMRRTLACLFAALLLCSLANTTAFAGEYIRKFEARTPSVVSGDFATLEIQTVGAGRVYLLPNGKYLSLGDYDGVVRVWPKQTTTYTLVVEDLDRNELERAEAVVEAGPFAIAYYAATEVFIGRAETTTLSWHIDGTFTSAHVVGVTEPSPDPYGSVTFMPGSTQEFELRVTDGQATISEFLHIEVNQGFEESRFYLSWDHDDIQSVSPGVNVFAPFNVHVLAMSLEGQGIRGYEFGIDLPPGLEIIAVDYNDPLVLNIVQPPDFIVGYGYCLPTDNVLYRILTLHVIATNEDVIDSGFIKLRPAVVQSVPNRLAYVTCNNSLEGSEFNAAREALTGPPLYLTPQDQVPTLQLGFRAVKEDANVRLQWGELPYPLVDRVQLGRSEAGMDAQPLVSFRGEDLLQLRSYLDTSAPMGVELSYVLRAYDGQELLAEETTKLASESGELPGRTRISGNFPNPFNPETTIRFDATRPGSYEFHIVDTAGRRVRMLQREIAAPGSGYEIRWNGMDENGRPAASGVYFVQLRGPDIVDHHRIALIK